MNTTRALVVVLLSLSFARAASAGPAAPRPPARSAAPADLDTSVHAVADGSLFFADERKQITAVSLSAGRVAWVRTLPGWAVGGVVAGGGLVVAATTEGRVHALDARTGAPRWQAALGGKPDRIPRLDGADLLISVGKRTLVLLDLGRGTRRWKRTLDSDLELAPALLPRTVVVTGNERVEVLERATGKLRASQAVPTAVTAPLVTGDRVYVTAHGEPAARENPYDGTPERPAPDAPRPGILTAMKLEPLGKAWTETYQPASGGGEKLERIHAPVAATATMVVSLTDGGRLTGHHASHGLARWHQNLRGDLVDVPTVVDASGAVLVIATRAEVVAVAIDTGIVRWRRSLTCPLGTRLHLVGGRVLVQRPQLEPRYEVPVFDLATGKPGARILLPESETVSEAPGVVVGGELLIRGGDDAVLRLDAATGKVVRIPVRSERPVRR